MEEILWTPRLEGLYDFSVCLDRAFAEKMIQTKILPKNQTGMNELANLLLKKLGTSWSNPYEFHEDSCFIHKL